MNTQRRWPAPWVFSVLIWPLGMAWGFNVTALPFLLAKAASRGRGITAENLGAIKVQ